MNQLRKLPLAAALLGLAACADTPTAVVPSLAKVTAVPTADRYLVRVNGGAAKFTSAVSALGGKVAYIHDGAGIAVVSGLSGERATKLAGNASTTSG